MQPDLFTHNGLNLKPATDRIEPRLWVRRLIIWREQGNEIRNIPLRAGLNIIWSPDDGSRRGHIGHGGGKTTFCRLMRYCLGEETLGPEAQRRAILDQMPAGLVGAEVRLNGETWLIRRSFHPHKDDHAFRAPSFAEVSDFPAEPTGMQPFLEAAAAAFLDGALPLVPASIGSQGAWQALLAWLSRDQECRFGHLLDWRSPDSGSRSPVSGRNRPQDDREAIVRIVLNALRTEEIEARRNWESANSALIGRRTQAGRLAWRLAESRKRLAVALALNADNTSGLDVAIIKAAASERLAKLQGLPSPATLDQLHSARSDVEQAFEILANLRAAIEIASSKKETAEAIAKVIGDELPELSAQNQRLANPVCPVCGVLIDKARAEGCGISLQSCDLEALRAKAEQQKKTREDAIAEAARGATELTALKGKLAAAGQALERQRADLAAIERAVLDRSQELRRAERLWDGAVEFEEASAEVERTESEISAGESQLKELAEKLEGHRDAVAELISELSERFDAVFRELVPGETPCSVKLDGNGLGLRVPVNGAAIDSLKVAVFDMAVLSMAIEGKTRHPGFLVHDSPREADLGRSIYAGMFDLAKKLEGAGSAPLFQYIVTTTTEPPTGFCSLPWLRFTVRSAPVEERLLKANL